MLIIIVIQSYVVKNSNIKFYVSEYAASLESLVNVVAPEKLSIVVQVRFIMRMLMYLYHYFYMRMENLQGYFAPIAVKYANEHQDKLNHNIPTLMLINFNLLRNST
jgi:hypothetical protein